MNDPVKYNIVLRKGCDYKRIFKFIQDDDLPMNLEGWAVKSQIRMAKRRDSDLVVEFTATIPVPINGEIQLELTDVQTGLLTTKMAHWDMLLISPAEFDEIYVEGQVYIEPTVTSKE
jgi:hypothetical protein